MKITGLQQFKFSVPTGNPSRDPATGALLGSVTKPWLFVKLTTDVGIDGWGEGTGEWLVDSVEATLASWKELVVGRDPLLTRAITDDIVNRIPWRGGPVFGTAIAALSMALFDVAGKAWQAPVHALLGGKRRDRVRVYRGGSLFESPEQAVAIARAAAEAGYAGVKGNPLEFRSWPMDGSSVSDCVACVKGVRETMGESFDVMLDCHGSPTPELALQFAESVAPYRPLFLEEPLKVGSIEALAAMHRRSPVPIATGEKLFSREQFQAIIARRACAFLQPDLSHSFGIPAMVDVARAAELEQILMAPHMAGGPLMYAATLHVDAVTPNFLIQETNYFEQFALCAEHDWRIAQGYVNVSDLPGLGVTVKEQELGKLRYEPLPFRQYRHADGSWKGW